MAITGTVSRDEQVSPFPEDDWRDRDPLRAHAGRFMRTARVARLWLSTLAIRQRLFAKGEPQMFALDTPVLCTMLVLAQSGWVVSAGRESFTYRDIARSGPPADASPVSWTGVGP